MFCILCFPNGKNLCGKLEEEVDPTVQEVWHIPMALRWCFPWKV